MLIVGRLKGAVVAKTEVHLAYLVDGRQLEERKTQQYLDEERRRHPS